MEGRDRGSDRLSSAVLGYLRRHHLGLIAIFIALTGTAYAVQKTAPKNSVVTKSIRKGAVTHRKLALSSVDGSNVRDGSLTGADVNASTLDTVPSATRADHATSADSATTAGSATHAASATSADSATHADNATTADSAAKATQAADSSKLGGVDASSYLEGFGFISQGDLTGTYENPRVELRDSAVRNSTFSVANAACPSGATGPSVTVHVPASGLVEVMVKAELLSLSETVTACITVDGGGNPRTVFKVNDATPTYYSAGSNENGTKDPFAAQWVPIFGSSGTHTFTLAFGSAGSPDFVDNALLIVRAIS
jgi:hypothetical protein